MRFNPYLYLLIGLLFPSLLLAQAPRRWSTAEIHQGIQKLNFLGSALYIAAHPDDENTRLIAYLSNELKANTAYLSLTRGDGGQNLIGPEIRELLGVIRTQELLAARRVDGGSQFFTRANDFGYSKTAEETFNIWDKEAVLGDVVWAIRRWRPDIVINRFDHTGKRRTHGHHTGSAMLSVEAFDLAGDPQAYPEQLEYYDPWQPERLFFNTTWWFYGSPEAFEKEADTSRMLKMDVGVYYPATGYSNTEIASISRSQHKSQGFGSSGSRGSQMEYLESLKGDMPEGKRNPFEGINTSWTRLEGGAPIGEILARVEATFDFTDPARSVPDLMQAYQLIRELPDGHWKRVKTEEIKEVIAACLGLFLEPVAASPTSIPGESVTLELEAVNRSDLPVVFTGFEILPGLWDTTLELTLVNNRGWSKELEVELAGSMDLTNAYWLDQPWALGMYTVKDQRKIGLPETERRFSVAFDFRIDGYPIRWEREVIFKRTDPVKGEVYRPFEILPGVSLSLDQDVQIFTQPAPQEVNVLVRAHREDMEGRVQLQIPAGWEVEPREAAFRIPLKGGVQRLQFLLTPPAEPSEGIVRPMAIVGADTFRRELVEIQYDHIPRQMVFRSSESKVVKIDLQRAGERIGYLMGAGDEVPASLREMGYQVVELTEESMQDTELDQFDAIITGIRAYNVLERIRFVQPRLLDYVENGGTLLVQYNTNRRLQLPEEEISPYALELSRDRVTVEEAEVRFLEPDHPVLNYPNRITPRDFEGWVQERGLYFPDQWGEEFTAILSMNDPGEDPLAGSLLVAPYGQGHYVYTGLSFFRELPAGVPGAYRLFANLLSLGKKDRP